MNQGRGGYVRGPCRTSGAAPPSGALATSPWPSSPAVCTCPHQAAYPGVEEHFQTATRRFSARHAPSKRGAQRGDAAPRTAPFQGEHARLGRAANHCCATCFTQFGCSHNPHIQYRQGRTGALRRRNWARRQLHTRGSGRYPGTGGGPSPSHLSETGSWGHLIALRPSAEHCPALRYLELSSPRREYTYHLRVCMTWHVSPFRCASPRRPRPRICTPKGLVLLDVCDGAMFDCNGLQRPARGAID